MSAIAKLAATIVLVVLCSLSLALENKTTALLDDIKKYETCVLKCVFSFYFPEYSPPRTQNDFKTMCRRQSEGFKCIKERTKGAAPLIKRGLLTMVGTRQRQHKKLCSHPDSEHSKKFLAASKCLMEKKLEPLRENDLKIAMTHAEILRRNYNDSTAELKQICCSLYNYKKGFYDIANDGCPGHKAMLDELIESIVTKDSSLVCDDDEKLANLCPQLEPLKPSNSSNFKAQSSVSTVLYLMATLGEPDEGLPVIN